MTVIADLIAKLTCDPSEFIKGMGMAVTSMDKSTKEMLKKLDAFDRSMNKTFRDFNRYLGLAALTYYAKGVVNTADELSKLSKQTSISTEALSEYQYVIRQTTEDFEGFIKSVESVRRLTSDAAAGVKSAQQAFRDLGLDARELVNQKPDEIFERVVEALGKVENANDRAAIAQDLFGKSAGKTLQLVSEGAGAIKNMREEAAALGLTLSQDVANDFATFDDEITELTDRLKMLATKGLHPVVSGWNELLSGARQLRVALHSIRLEDYTNQLQRASKAGNMEVYQRALSHIEQEQKAIDALTTELSNENAARERKNRIQAQGGPAARTAIDHAKEEKKALDEARNAAQAYLHATEEIQDALADAFFSGETAAEKFKTVVLSIFKEIAAAAVIRPVIAPVVAGVAQSLAGDLVGKAVGEGLGIKPTDILSLGGSGKGMMADLAGTLGVKAGTLSTLMTGLSVAGIGFAGGNILSGLLGMNSTGGSVGGSLGSLAGFAVGGPLGALAGGTLGSLLGGSFGGKPHPASTFGAYLTDTGSFKDPEYKSKHEGKEAAMQIAEKVQAMTEGLVAAGVSLGAVRIQGGKDVGKGGGFLEVAGGKRFTFNPESAEEFETALKALGQELLSLSGESRSLETVLTEAAEAEQRRLEILAQQNRFLNDLTDSYEDAAGKAEKLALDFRKMGQDLAKALFDLRISDGSALSPEEIYQLAAENFRSVRDKALGGDTEAMKALPDAARDFAEISREFNASNAQFKQDFAEIEAALVQVNGAALSLEEAQLDIAQQQLAMLEKIRAAIEGAGAEMDLSKLVKPGESLDSLSGINPVNMLPELLVRMKKQQLGFDFSGNQLFRDWVKSNPSAGAAFNDWVRSQGGVTQAFAEGGFPKLGVPMLVGEKGPEVYMPTAAGQVIPNNRLTVSSADPAMLAEAMQAGFTKMALAISHVAAATQRQAENFARLESRMMARG